MGMYCQLQQIPADLFDRFQNDSDSAIAFFEDEPEEAQDLIELDLDKTWAVLHFVLTGDPFGGDPPLAYAIRGEQPISEDYEALAEYFGDSFPLCNSPERVIQIASAMSQVDFENLWGQRDFASVADDLYEFDVSEIDEIHSDATGFFNQLVAFYKDAAAKGNAVISTIG